MDLFAYNEDAFTTWVCELEGVASRNATLQAAGESRTKEAVWNHSRPSSSHSLASRASVAPSMDIAPSHDNHVTRGRGESSAGGRNRTDTSIFLAPSPSLKARDKQDLSEEYAYSGDVI